MKLRTLLGLGVGYAIGSYFGPDRIQRVLASLTDQDSEQRNGSTDETDTLQDASWPSTQFES
jgi:hypothetical protein